MNIEIAIMDLLPQIFEDGIVPEDIADKLISNYGCDKGGPPPKRTINLVSHK